MATATAFQASAPVAFAKGKLGLYFAWAAFSKKDGEDFYDAHGDHIPDDDLVAGALSLSKAKLLKVEHAGEGRGEIPLVFPLTTDIAKSLGVESNDSGLMVGFQPDAELAAAIDAGEFTELSIAGEAMAELVKAAYSKSAGGEKPKRKRKLLKPRIDEVSLVKRAAHGEGTRIAIAKRAPDDADAEKSDSESALTLIAKAEPVLLRAPIAKGSHPALTTSTNGHSHLLYDVDCEGGSTSHEYTASGDYRTGHSHPWVRVGGSVVVGEADGHTHDIATESTTMSKAADPVVNPEFDAATKRVSLLKSALVAALSAPADQRAYAAKMTVDQAESFFAKSEGDRASEVAGAVAYTSKTGEVFYKTDDQRLVAFAKREDDRAVEFEKAREAAELATFEKKAADELPHLNARSRALFLKAAGGNADALDDLKRADAAVAFVTKSHGIGSKPEAAQGAEAELEGIAKGLIAANPSMTFAKAYDAALMTERGQALYQQLDQANRAPARA